MCFSPHVHTYMQTFAKRGTNIQTLCRCLYVCIHGIVGSCMEYERHYEKNFQYGYMWMYIISS